MGNTKRGLCHCLIAFEYAQLGKNCNLQTTPKFLESYHFVENQPTRCCRGRKPIDDRNLITFKTRAKTLHQYFLSDSFCSLQIAHLSCSARSVY